MKRHRRHFCFGFFAMARVRQHPSCTLLVSVEENAVPALAVPPRSNLAHDRICASTGKRSSPVYDESANAHRNMVCAAKFTSKTPDVSDAPMANLALHPPVHVLTHPEEPIRSLEAAAKFVRRQVEGRIDPGAEMLVKQLEAAETIEQGDAAGNAFREWAEQEGLLLIPPEDHAA